MSDELESCILFTSPDVCMKGDRGAGGKKKKGGERS